jgi:hypothetical protein
MEENSHGGKLGVEPREPAEKSTDQAFVKRRNASRRPRGGWILTAASVALSLAG